MSGVRATWSKWLWRPLERLIHEECSNEHLFQLSVQINSWLHYILFDSGYLVSHCFVSDGNASLDTIKDYPLE